MEVKLVSTKEFYPTMEKWWDGHNMPHVSPSILPNNTFIVYNNSKPIYSMCFYNTDSNLAWVGWQLSNPEVNKEDKKGCFSFLFTEVEKYARMVGYQVIFTTSNTPSVVKILNEREFIVGDNSVKHYTKIL